MLPFAQAREGAAEAVRLLRVLEARLARDTVNIGVSGQARVGKSTLLQSVSGLGDDQIPTGQALPVTAVRSRIFHAPDLRRATLRLHSFDTFVTDVARALPRRAGHRGAAGAPRRSSGTGPTPSLRNRQARRLPPKAAVAPRGFA